MIVWADELYYDQHVKRRRRRIMRAVQRDKLVPGIFCITLSSNPQNLLDVVRMDLVKHSYEKHDSIYVLGLAFGRMSALELVTQIVDEVYQNTGDVKLREYYQDRWKTC